MLVKVARAKVGGTSNVSKMPQGCTCWGLSAIFCNVGSKLQLVEGSVCSVCYALGGMYVFENVIIAHARREEALSDPEWVPAMATIVIRKPLMRWFDSGDLRDMALLRKIVAVASLTPDTRHWLPTKEYGILAKYKRGGGIYPSNLVVRESAPMIDAFFPESRGPSSGVIKDKPAPDGVYVCPAKEQDNKCGPCRACWDPTITRIGYRYH